MYAFYTNSNLYSGTKSYKVFTKDVDLMAGFRGITNGVTAGSGRIKDVISSPAPSSFNNMSWSKFNDEDPPVLARRRSLMEPCEIAPANC